MTLFEYVQRGGPIMYILILANIISFTIIIWKYLVLSGEKKNINALADNLLNSMRNESEGQLSFDYAKERIEHHVHSLEKGLNIVKITATTSPLLGLLGTVLGILVAFETISAQGLGKPELFASGIAMALITTAGGLLVAIPNNIFYNFLTSSLNNIQMKLEEILIPKINNSGK